MQIVKKKLQSMKKIEVLQCRLEAWKACEVSNIFSRKIIDKTISELEDRIKNAKNEPDSIDD